ncbi:MAG: hypothetical protein SynsKO_21660 [Synoicihabitans sp.]
MKTRRDRWLVTVGSIALFLLVAVIWLRTVPSSVETIDSAERDHRDSEFAAPSFLKVGEEQEAANSKSITTVPPISPQSEATDRMIAAHESLRVPSVANPDSATNREMLEAMVLKALARNLSEQSASN